MKSADRQDVGGSVFREFPIGFFLQFPSVAEENSLQEPPHRRTMVKLIQKIVSPLLQLPVKNIRRTAGYTVRSDCLCIYGVHDPLPF